MKLVVPGDSLGKDTEFTAGNGTYTLKDTIYASVVGVVSIVESDEKNTKPLIEISQDKPPSIVPEPNDIVTCKVTKINARMATVQILCVGTTLLQEPLNGTIRQRDVRSFDIDSVEIYKSFRPGDVVRAQVLSLGDSRSYYLSTGKNELGVVLAKSISGEALVPVSWEEMQCPSTLKKEFRKVAKFVNNDNGDGARMDTE